MADGSLKFDTKIDDSGFLEGIQNLSSKQIKLQNVIKKTRDEMEKLEKSMDEAKNTKVPTEEYQDIQKQIESAQKKLNTYIETEQRMKDTGAKLSGQAWKNLQYNIDAARNTVRAAKADMESLETSGGAFKVGADTSKLTEMQNKYDGLKGKLAEYTARLAEATGKEALEESSAGRVSSKLELLSVAATKAWSGVKKLGSIAGTVAGKLGNLAVSAGKAAGKAIVNIGKLNTLFSRGQKSASGFGTKIGSVIKSMILYQGVSRIIRGIATTMWTMLKTNDQFVSSLAQIKGNLYTAFQPILTAVMPAINILMAGLVKLTGYLAQFTSMLFGKSVSASQAAAKAQYDQAKALDKTAKSAKKANKQLSDIDQLHNLTDDDSGSSGDSGVAPDFATSIDTSDGVSDFVQKLKDAWKTTDFTEIGGIIADKINNALESINWEKVQATTQKIAKSIYTLINGFVGGLDWKLVGTSIGNGINAAVEFANTLLTGIDWKKVGSSLGTGLDNAIKTINWTGIGTLVSNGLNSIASYINSFYKSVNWTGLGTNLATAANTAVKNTDWSGVGMAIGNALNIAIKTAYGFVTSFDWKQFGQGIANGINSALTTTDWVTLAQGASRLVTGLLDTLITAVKGVDWLMVGTTIGDMINNIDWGGIAGRLIDLLVAAFNGLVSVIFGIGKTVGKNIMDGLKSGITLSDIIKNAATWINNHIFKPIVDNIKSLFGIHSPSTVMKEIGINLMQGMINGIISLVNSVKEKFKTLVSDIKGFFTGIPDWFKGKFDDALAKIKSVFGTSAVSSHFSGLWTTIKSCFGNVSDWFKDTFTKAWTNVKNVFSTGGKIFDGIKEGIGDTFKSVVNKLIDGMNAIITVPFNKINSALDSIKSIEIPVVGKVFSGLPTIPTPRIPKLATGTVVPRNYGEFLSILGDNKKETEVVSPLSIIRKALREELNSGGTGNGDMTLHLTVIRDGKKEYDEIMKINKEEAASGNLSFALS